MRKLRELSKTCPECQKKVGVALKSCQCGFNFTRQTRSGTSDTIPQSSRPRRELTRPSSSLSATGSRRQGRVRTAKKPNFYDSQEFDKKKKKKVTRASSAKTTILGKHQNSTEQDESPNSSKELREARAKQRRIKKEETEDVDLADKLPLDKQELAQIILAEINRKLTSVTVKL